MSHSHRSPAWSRLRRVFCPASQRGAAGSLRHTLAGLMPLSRPLRCEPLEDRRLLTVFTVDSLLDVVQSDGLITLRESLEAANTNVAVHDAPAVRR